MIFIQEDPEDPPETLHTPWGIWLHWRDAMHRVQQKFDTAHLIRTGMAAEDILHYAHYVPAIEGPDEHSAPKKANAEYIEYQYFDPKFYATEEEAEYEVSMPSELEEDIQKMISESLEINRKIESFEIDNISEKDIVNFHSVVENNSIDRIFISTLSGDFLD